MTDDPTRPAGWYPDEGVDAPPGQQRYWDGSAWTEHTTAPTAPAYPAAVQQAPRNGLGIAALILGIIGVVIGIIPFFFWLAGILGVIGLILGFVGRGRAKRGEATNGTMALWGIITSAVAVVVSIAILIAWEDLRVEFRAGPENTGSPDETPAPTQAQETAAPGAGEVDVLDLRVGDCLADSPTGGEEVIFTVETVPCSEPHSGEIYAVVTLPEGDFPGDEAVVAQAEESCTAEFESFVGLPYEESVLYFTYLHPSDEQSWIAGNHLVTCSVFDPAGDTTGTLADANR
jgi:hypothetical protein